MDILTAVESHYDSIIKKSAFDINVCIKNQVSNNAFENLILAIKQYSSAKSQLEIVKGIKAQIESLNNENQTNTINNQSGSEQEL